MVVRLRPLRLKQPSSVVVLIGLLLPTFGHDGRFNPRLGGNLSIEVREYAHCGVH